MAVVVRHVMVDIETLGTKPGSVILSIGAVEFSDDRIGERFYRPIDVFDSLMCGLKVDEATIGFWRMQNAQAKSVLKPAMPLNEALDGFRAFVAAYDGTALWAKGPDFDCVLLEAAYAAIGQKKPWSYRAVRDVRTILALAPGAAATVERSRFIAHHALGDAQYQAEQVMAAAKQLGFPLAEMA